MYVLAQVHIYWCLRNQIMHVCGLWESLIVDSYQHLAPLSAISTDLHVWNFKCGKEFYSVCTDVWMRTRTPPRPQRHVCETVLISLFVFTVLPKWQLRQEMLSGSLVLCAASSGELLYTQETSQSPLLGWSARHVLQLHVTCRKKQSKMLSSPTA